MKTTASKPSSTPYFRVGKLTTGSWRSFSAAKGPGAVKALGLARLQPSSLVSFREQKSMQMRMEESAMRTCQVVKEGSGQHLCDLSNCLG